MTPAAFAACAPGAAISHCSGATMGTGWSLQMVAPSTDVAAPAATEALVRAAFDRVVEQMSQWEPMSDLSRFNRAPAGRWHDIPDELAQVVGAALAIAAASNGAFNPALGAVSEAWGFGAAGPVATAPPAAPGGYRPPRIDHDPGQARVRRSEGALLDLSGIAKGYAVDLASDWLLASGVRHFLLEVGGELRGEGIRPDGQPWWVDVEPPPATSFGPWRIALHDLAVATSGNYRRGLTVDGKYYSHSFDPRTGRPIIGNVSSSTVLHRRCMMADGWATALTVLGPEKAMALADAQGLAAHMIAGEREYVSREWRAMLA